MIQTRRSFVVLVLVLVLVALPALPAGAWNSSGHMQVAAIAWSLLPGPSRAKVAALLAQHPRYREDFLAVRPAYLQHGSQAARDQWLFMHAAVWPDVARELPDAIRDQYHRPSWHYINQPIYLNDDSRHALAGTIARVINLDRALPDQPESAKLNVVQALKLAVTKIHAAETTPGDKALYLSWLLHLVGDVHQPLHTVALCSSRRFPAGDLGGNSIELRGRGKLHGVWDGAAGSGVAPSYVSRRARAYLARPELAAAGADAALATRFAGWIEEGYDLAQSDVYHAEILAAVDAIERSSKPADREKTPSVALPQDYVERMRAVAERRMVEAGYRLAQLISVQLQL